MSDDTGVGNAAANWHTDMPPGGMEHREEPASEESLHDPKHSGFLYLIVLFSLHHIWKNLANYAKLHESTGRLDKLFDQYQSKAIATGIGLPLSAISEG